MGLVGMEGTAWSSFNVLLGNVPNLIVPACIPVDAPTNAMLLALIDDCSLQGRFNQCSLGSCGAAHGSHKASRT